MSSFCNNAGRDKGVVAIMFGRNELYPTYAEYAMIFYTALVPDDENICRGPIGAHDLHRLGCLLGIAMAHRISRMRYANSRFVVGWSPQNMVSVMPRNASCRSFDRAVDEIIHDRRFDVHHLAEAFGIDVTHVAHPVVDEAFFEELVKHVGRFNDKGYYFPTFEAWQWPNNYMSNGNGICHAVHAFVNNMDPVLSKGHVDYREGVSLVKQMLHASRLIVHNLHYGHDGLCIRENVGSSKIYRMMADNCIGLFYQRDIFTQILASFSIDDAELVRMCGAGAVPLIASSISLGLQGRMLDDVTPVPAAPVPPAEINILTEDAVYDTMWHGAEVRGSSGDVPFRTAGYGCMIYNPGNAYTPEETDLRAEYMLDVLGKWASEWLVLMRNAGPCLGVYVACLDALADFCIGGVDSFVPHGPMRFLREINPCKAVCAFDKLVGTEIAFAAHVSYSDALGRLGDCDELVLFRIRNASVIDMFSSPSEASAIKENIEKNVASIYHAQGNVVVDTPVDDGIGLRGSQTMVRSFLMSDTRFYSMSDEAIASDVANHLHLDLVTARHDVRVVLARARFSHAVLVEYILGNIVFRLQPLPDIKRHHADIGVAFGWLFDKAVANEETGLLNLVYTPKRLVGVSILLRDYATCVTMNMRKIMRGGPEMTLAFDRPRGVARLTEIILTSISMHMVPIIVDAMKFHDAAHKNIEGMFYGAMDQFHLLFPDTAMLKRLITSFAYLELLAATPSVGQSVWFLPPDDECVAVPVNPWLEGMYIDESASYKSVLDSSSMECLWPPTTIAINHKVGELAPRERYKSLHGWKMPVHHEVVSDTRIIEETEEELIGKL